MHTHILLLLLEMAHVTVDAKKSHNLPSAILRPGELTVPFSRNSEAGGQTEEDVGRTVA